MIPLGKQSLNRSLGRFHSSIAHADAMDLAIRASLCILIFSGWVVGFEWIYYTPIFMLATLGLMVPNFYRSKWIWYGIALMMSLKSLSQWWVQDNHVFVLNYWTIAIAVALSTENPSKVLALNGRVLLGLSFFFAVVWKGFLSPDYMDGGYFHFTFLTDARFSQEAALLGKLSLDTIQSNIDTVTQTAGGDHESGQLATNDGMRLAAVLITWHTIIIEALLAIAFLWPWQGKIKSSRNALMLIFAWTTYLAAPVHTFGWTLTTLCIAQTAEKERVSRFLLVLTLPLLIVYKYVPIMEFLAPIGQRLLY